MEKEHASLEELITGSVVKELPDNTELEPNAELERDEYLMYPDGKVQKVVGEKHEGGGVKMYLPDGTKILTNSIKPDTGGLKRVREELGIEGSKKDTYADLMEKYKKHIGFYKANKEQEEAVKSLKEMRENDKMDDNTKSVNIEYLSQIINETEESKSKLQGDIKNAFDTLFKDQEEKKNESSKYNDMEDYQYGGVTNLNIKKVADKYGLTVEETLRIIEPDRFKLGGVQKVSVNNNLKYNLKKFKKGGVKTYENGGEITFKTTDPTNKDKNISIKYESAEHLDKIKKAWEKYEKARENQSGTELTSDYKKAVVNLKSALGEGDRESLDSFLEGESKDKAKPVDEQIYGVRHKNLGATFPETQEAGEATIEQELEEVVIIGDKEKEETEKQNDTDIEDKGVQEVRQRPIGTYFHPNQTPHPPRPINPMAMVTPREYRVGTPAVGWEQPLSELQAVGRQTRDQFRDLPAHLRAAGALATQATLGRESSNLMQSVAAKNAELRARSDLFNTQAASKEDARRGQAILSHEARARSEQDVKERERMAYWDRLSRGNVQRFYEDQRLDTYAAMTPQYSVDPWGRPVHDPTYEAGLYDSRNIRRLREARGIQQKDD